MLEVTMNRAGGWARLCRSLSALAVVGGGLLACCSVATAAPVGLLANNGFEDGTLGTLSTLAFNGVIQVSSAEAFSGSKSARAANTGGSAFVFGTEELTIGVPPFGPGINEIYMRAHVKIADITPVGAQNDTEIMGLIGPGILGYPATVGIDASDRLYVQIDTVGGAIRQTGSVVSRGVWHYIELHYVHDNTGNTGGAEVWLDNPAFPDLSTSFLFNTNWPTGLYRVGSSVIPSVTDDLVEVFFDDIALDDANQIGPVPEPATLAMLSLGGLMALRRR